MNRKLFWFTLVVLMALLLSSCQPQATPTPTQAPAEEAPTVEEAPVTEEQPAEQPAVEEPTAGRKVARFIFTQEFDSLNPLYTNMWFSAITQQIWNAWVWDFDEQTAPHPVLVTEIPSLENGGINEDGTVITLTLRQDLKWSDGEPLTAADLVFTANMAVDPNNAVASAYPYDQLESIEATDDYTVVMTFKEPFAPWLGTFWHGILPEHILRPVYESEGNINNAEWNLAPTVGCGPFVFAEWESGSFARFVANENYWLGKPKLDEIFIRFVPDDASQVAALKAGDADFGTFMAYPDIPPLQEAGLKMVQVFSGYNEGWYFLLDPETGHPALQDARVRQALAYGFDRFSLTKDLLLGLTKPAATYWDNTPYVDPTIQPYPYDPEKAKALLDEAGWIDSNGDGVRDKDGVELVLKYGTTTREIRQDTQAVAQQQLGEIGIKLDLLNADYDIFFSGYGEGGPAATGQYDMWEYSTVSEFPDPDTSEWLCSDIPSDEKPAGLNWMRLCDEELDSLFKQQAKQVDFEQRQQTFYKITRLIFDKAYWIGLWQDPDIYALGPQLSGVKLSGATPFFNIIEWDLQP